MGTPPRRRVLNEGMKTKRKRSYVGKKSDRIKHWPTLDGIESMLQMGGIIFSISKRCSIVLGAQEKASGSTCGNVSRNGSECDF